MKELSGSEMIENLQNHACTSFKVQMEQEFFSALEKSFLVGLMESPSYFFVTEQEQANGAAALETSYFASGSN